MERDSSETQRDTECTEGAEDALGGAERGAGCRSRVDEGKVEESGEGEEGVREEE